MMTTAFDEVAEPGDPGSATAMIIDRDEVLAAAALTTPPAEIPATQVLEALDAEEPLAALVSEVPPASMPAVQANAVPPVVARRGSVGAKLGIAVAAAAVVMIAIAAAALYWLGRRIVNESSATASPATAPVTLAAAALPNAEPTTVAVAAPPPVAAALMTQPAPPSPLVVLSITSEPAGARVIVGRTARGRTPTRVEVAPGTWAVAIEKDGFKPWRREVRASGGAQDVRAALEPVPPKVKPAPPTPPSPAMPVAGQIVPLGADVTPPRKLSGSSPALPKDAPRRRLTGSVLVDFVVTETGAVVDVKVLESAGEALDRACLEAVAGWRYTPASLRGASVRTKQQARFTFVAR
jgi:TonB family protein